MNFEIIGEITEIETIAIGKRIRELARLTTVWSWTLAEAERSGSSTPAKR